MIDANRIEEILKDCLFTKEEVEAANGEPKNIVEAEGLFGKLGLNSDRVGKHKEEIKKILSELPDEFMEDKGGGMSFLNMCNDKEGNQWGEHKNMDQLYILGNACGFAKFNMPREFWTAFPGGLPYIIINLKEEEVISTGDNYEC
jgi:hypothetical protein